jgi:hypothetical protein
MTSLSREQLRQLREASAPPCVSIYLPTLVGGGEVQQNRIRLKNLLRAADEQLSADGLERRRREELLAPGHLLLDDNAFWQHQSGGLALLLAGGDAHTFRAPFPFPERAVVGERFHLAPLLPLLDGDGYFNVLALSQNEVRVFAATRDDIHELELADVPRSLQDALHLDQAQPALQFHSPGGGPQGQAMRASGGGPAGAVRGGRRQAIFHGHGGVDDDAKELVRRFVQVVDTALLEHLRRRPAPLVLAAVEYKQALFRSTSKHPQLVAEGIEGNPEGLSAEQLRQRAWPLVEPLLHADRQRAAATIEELAATERVGRDLEEVLPAALDGRVDTLFVDVSRPRWGRFDGDTRTVEVHEERQAGDEDLLDRAAAETLLHGGNVHATIGGEAPGGGLLAALFRY